MGWIKISKNYKRGLTSVIIILGLWETLVSYGLINALLVSKPSQIIFDGFELIISGKLWPHFLISIEAISIGFVLAILFGVALGVVIGFNDAIYDYARPFVYALNALPVVAIVPLIIIWFGIAITSKISIIFLMSISPILISTIDGVKNVDKDSLRMAKSFGAESGFIIRTVVFFYSLPYIFTGVRVAVGKAVVGLIIAEVFGYGRGLGYLVSFYGATFQTSRLMFVIAVLLVFSMAGSGLVTFLERKYIFWK